MTQPGPLPEREAMIGVAKSVRRSLEMLARGDIHQPREHVGRRISFGDGTTGRVYRETRVDQPCSDPCVLVVAFRLRAVRGWGHLAFERESILHTPLFVGFPGFGSKLWLAHDDHDVYRGLYEWDGPITAEQYARSLWRVLELVSAKGSIDYRVIPDLRRDDLLADPGRLTRHEGSEAAWWRVVHAA